MAYREDDEGAPVDILDRDWSDLHDRKHAHPVDKAAECLASRSNPRRGDLGRIKPRHGKPAEAKENLEQEDHGSRSVRSGGSSKTQ